jgi:hypothetical protein
MTITKALQLPLWQRLKGFKWGSQNISSFTLDTETYTGYKGYSFFYEMTLVKQPERTQDGSMDLSSHAYFITPHLRIDFSLISYDDFVRIRKQQLSKLTFNLTCFDTDHQTMLTTEEVYFHPDSLPKFELMARRLNGEKWTEILGAKDYTVELVGTNRLVKKNIITYNLNVPSDVSWSGDTSIEKQVSSRSTVGIGNQAFIWNGTYNGEQKEENKLYERVSTLTFGNKYRFVKWVDDTDFGYVDGNEYFITGNLNLTAIWEKSV